MFDCLNGVDWDLLHRQKLVLIEWLSGKSLKPPQLEELWGIVHLLDALQDDAVVSGRWRFPEDCDQKGGVMASRRRWGVIAPQVIYHAYPENDLLPIEPPKVNETIGEFVVRAEGAGDTLFLFLCREANDDIDVEEYLHRLDCARRDLVAVHDAFDNFLNDAVPHPPSAADSLP